MSPASYLSALQSTAEWTAAIVCPDNALQSSFHFITAKKAQTLGYGGFISSHIHEQNWSFRNMMKGCVFVFRSNCADRLY